MSKVIKQMEMEALKADFNGVRDMVVLTTKGLTCQGDYMFRAQLRKKSIRLKGVKNSLARRVFNELGLNVSQESPYWAGQSIFAFGGASISELCRAIDSELKSPKNGPLYKDKVTIKGAITEGVEMPFEQAIKMPTREEAIARVVMLALSPASRLVSQLQGPGASVASQIKSISEKTAEAAPAA